MKKIISLVLCMVMSVSLLLPSSAMASDTSTHFEYEAQMLYNLGLFKGTENGFDLDKPCDRLQGSTLFIRLLGEEKDAISNPKSHPFSDVQNSWASPYIGQMYQQGYTKGISATEYGISNMTANQFATFCLRALNYNDSAGDFHYNSALDKMLELRIINQEAYDIISNQDFTRDCAVKLAYSTLFADINGTEKEVWTSDYFPDLKGTEQDKSKIYPATKDILIMNLIRANVVDRNVFQNSILRIYDDLYFYTSKESISRLALKYEEQGNHKLFVKYEDHITNFYPFLAFELPRYENGLIPRYNVESDLKTRSLLRGNSNIYQVDIDYRENYNCNLYLRNPSLIELNEDEKEIVDYTKKNFLDVYIKDGMSDYEKILAAYEFTMDSITYGYIASPKSILYKGLILHQGVCSTYASLFLYLANTLDIEAYIIRGEASGSGHAWNKVKLGDDYYNVDATWDDSNYTANTNYKYFLVSDKYISSSHKANNDIELITEKIRATNTQYDPK